MKSIFKMKPLIGVMAFVYAGLGGTVAHAVQTVDSAIPAYQPASGISGNLSSVGSDTLANLMTLWAEDYNRAYPNVNIQIQAAGSSTAPPALTEGTSNIGPMSREMKDDEIEAFEGKHGYKPTAIPVAVDALAVLVNKDNPIKGLTMEQVDGIFSTTNKCGGNASIETGVMPELLPGAQRVSSYTDVTPFPVPTVILKNTPCVKATLKATLMSSPAQLRSCNRLRNRLTVSDIPVWDIPLQV
jgi:PBP superfamily domain